LRLRRSASEVGKHGEHAAVVVARLAAPELLKDVADVGLHRFRAQEQLLADPFVRVPLGHERQDLPLALRELSELALFTRPPDQARDDSRIEHALTLVDAL
jgi:hypothetical protein